jgi:hypothetical protein
MLVALTIGCSHLVFGFKALASADVTAHWMAIPYSVFAAVALMAGAGDARMLRSGALRGGRRLARHLWRMSFALALAAFSGLPRLTKMIPKSAHIGTLLALPTLAVLVTMVYWLWRVRSRKTFRGIACVGTAEAVSKTRVLDGPPRKTDLRIAS